MKLRVIAVGTRMPAWVDAGFDDYARRMPRDARIELVEIKPEARTGRTVAQCLAAERERIDAAAGRDALRVALDERGTALTTADFSRRLAEWRDDGREVALLIGGPDGLHEDIRRSARLLLSLSAMTLPHGLARVLLAEQLYRAVSLLAGHPYHRE